MTETLRIDIFAPQKLSPEELARIIAGAQRAASLLDELRGTSAPAAKTQPQEREPEGHRIRPVYRMTPKGRVMVGFTSDPEEAADKPEPAADDKAELDAVAMIAAKLERVEKQVSALQSASKAIALISAKQCETYAERFDALEQRNDRQLRLIGKLHRRVRHLEDQAKRPAVIRHEFAELSQSMLRNLAAVAAMHAVIGDSVHCFRDETDAMFCCEAADALLAELNRSEAVKATA